MSRRTGWSAHQPGGNLTPAQIDSIKFAAAVLESYAAGRRTSQAARELRAMLPATDPADAGYALIHDHVGDTDDEDPAVSDHEEAGIHS